MKVAFLSPSLSRIAGGIFEIERDLALALDALPDTRVSAYGVIDRETAKDVPAWRHIPLHLGALKGPHGFGYSPELRRIFAGCDDDIVHLHALWMYTSVLARNWGRSTGRPYVTTANGMLEPWARENSSVKKKLAAFCYERAALRDLSCLHVNTREEAESARAFGVKGPFCIIPNGVVIPDPVPLDEAPAIAATIKAAGGKILFYLGRIHPKKNLLETVRAFVAVAPDHPDWHFVIAGWGSPDYQAQIEGLVADAGLAGRVHFVGPLYAREKAAMLAAADAFVLASLSEGFPMAILEAFASHLPVVMTRACNLNAGFEAGAALESATDAASIASCFNELFAMRDADRAELGAKGRALVEQRFTWDRIAVQMRAVYGWLLGGGAKPGTVLL